MLPKPGSQTTKQSHLAEETRDNSKPLCCTQVFDPTRPRPRALCLAWVEVEAQVARALAWAGGEAEGAVVERGEAR